MMGVLWRRWFVRLSMAVSAPAVGMALLIGLVLTAPAQPARAQGSLVADEEELFGSEEELFGPSDEDLFSGDEGLLVEVDSERSGSSLAEELLVRERVQIGGTYRLTLQSSWAWRRANPPGPAPRPNHTLGMKFDSTMFLDARPSTDFRLFAKAKSNAETSKSLLQLTELFADFNASERVFFRVGKQRINWGVGYFFSPADIVNIGRIDPQNPEAEREGPLALKANLPVGSNNYYLHAIADREAASTRMALAPKAEWVRGGTEWGLGGYYRDGKAPRGMVTFSTSLGVFSLFGEGVVSYGSDKRFVQVATGPGPLGVEVVTRKDEYFAHGTVGVRLAVGDPEGRFNLSGAGEYYFNGEGYPAGLLTEHSSDVNALIAAGELNVADLRNSGRHYAALSFNWSKALNSKLSPSLSWIGSLQDGSGMVTAALGVDVWESVRTSVGIRRTYGPASGAEYAPNGGETTLYVQASLGSDGT